MWAIYLFSSKTFYGSFKNSLITQKQNTKKNIAAKETLYVIKHTLIFTKKFPDFLGVCNIYIENSFANKLTKWA